MFELTPFILGNRYFSDFNPFKEMEDIEKRFFSRQLPTFENTSRSFRTDVRETENAYILDAELPGFAKEDIQAEIKDGILTIKAERKQETEEKDEKNNYIRRERSYGSFVRRFDLEGINADEISASYKNGILSLELPKSQAKIDEGRKLDIT